MAVKNLANIYRWKCCICYFQKRRDGLGGTQFPRANSSKQTSIVQSYLKKSTCYLNKCLLQADQNDQICEPRGLSHFPRTCLSWIKERREDRYFLLMWTPRRRSKTILKKYNKKCNHPKQFFLFFQKKKWGVPLRNIIMSGWRVILRRDDWYRVLTTGWGGSWFLLI